MVLAAAVAVAREAEAGGAWSAEAWAEPEAWVGSEAARRILGGAGGMGGAGGGFVGGTGGGFFVEGGQNGPAMNVDGNVEIFGAGGLKMKTGNGWVTVNIAPGAKVRYTNKATVNFLKVGVPVEFTAEVDAKHNVKNAVTQLTVVSLTADRGAGLFPEGSSRPKAAEANNVGLGAGGGFRAPKAAAAESRRRRRPLRTKPLACNCPPPAWSAARSRASRTASSP